MITGRSVAAVVCLITLSTSSPVIPGIITSRRTRSNGFSPSIRRAVSPSGATSTSYPCRTRGPPPPLVPVRPQPPRRHLRVGRGVVHHQNAGRRRVAGGGAEIGDFEFVV